MKTLRYIIAPDYYLWQYIKNLKLYIILVAMYHILYGSDSSEREVSQNSQKQQRPYVHNPNPTNIL